MVNVLITGHRGFVGRNLIRKMTMKHLDWTITGTENFHEFIDMSTADVKTKTTFEFDVIIHLAANIVNVDDRQKIGLKAYDDIALDLEVCKFVEKRPPTKVFICMSSCAVDCPRDPYCVIKRNLESFAMKLHKPGIPVTILRPFSGYGPDQSLEYPFPAILGRAMRREDPLTVWGGKQVRDWLHIDDLTDAIIYAIDHFPRGEPIEIGTGIGTRFFELAEAIVDVISDPHYQPEIKGLSNKETSSDWRVANTSNAEDYGWKSKIDLKTGIKMCIDKLNKKESK